MKIFTAIAAAGLLLTSATAAQAQDRHDDHGRMNRGHHDRNWGHHGGSWGHGGRWGHHGGWGRHCSMQWRHHHRVRVCR